MCTYVTEIEPTVIRKVTSFRTSKRYASSLFRGPIFRHPTISRPPYEQLSNRNACMFGYYLSYSSSSPCNGNIIQTKLTTHRYTTIVYWVLFACLSGHKAIWTEPDFNQRARLIDLRLLRQHEIHEREMVTTLVGRHQFRRPRPSLFITAWTEVHRYSNFFLLWWWPSFMLLFTCSYHWHVSRFVQEEETTRIPTSLIDTWW